MDLRQNQEGKWTLTVRHNTAGVTVQNAYLTFEHDGESESMDPFNVTNASKTLETGWYTALGTKLTDVGEIIKYPPDGYRFEQNNKNYVVNWDLSENPYEESGETQYVVIIPNGQSVIAASGGVLTFAVSSNTNWTLSSNKSWATLGTTSGTGNADNIELTFSTYTSTTKDRSVAITAHAGTASDSKLFTQMKAEQVSTIEIGASQTTIAASGGVISLEIVSNTAWTLSKTASASGWSSFNATAGTGNDSTKTITISPYNSTGNNRTVTITAKTVDNQTATIKITQNAIAVTNSLEITAVTNTVEYGGQLQLVALYHTYHDGNEVSAQTVTTSAGWSVTEGQNYATVNQGLVTNRNEGVDAQTAKIQVTYLSLSANKVLVMEGQGVPPVPVYTLEISPATVNMGANDVVKLTATLHTSVNGTSTSEDVTAECNWSVTSGDKVEVNNTQGNDRGTVTSVNAETVSGVCVVTATYSSVDVQPATCTINVAAHEPYYAVFTQKVDNMSYEYGQVSGFSVSANVQWWIVSTDDGVDPNNRPDWLVIGYGDFYGGPTSGNSFTMIKYENPTVSQRTARMKIIANDTIMDSFTVTQQRGPSNIAITGTAVNISDSLQNLSFEVTSNQNWEVTSYGSLVPVGATTGHSGSTTISFTVPQNTGSTILTHTIVVSTIDSPEYVDSDSYTFTQAKPSEPSRIYLSKSANTVGYTSITYRRDGNDDGDAQYPHGHNLTFYLSTNSNGYVSQIRCYDGESGNNEISIPDGFKLYDDQNREITSGISAGQIFDSTDNQYVPFVAYLPANATMGKVQSLRRFFVTFSTRPSGGTPMTATLVIHQFGNSYFIDNIHWVVDQGFPSAYTISSDEHIWAYDQLQSTAFVPQVCLMGRKYDAAETFSQNVMIGDDPVYGYLEGNCGLDHNLLTVTYPSWFNGYVTPQAEQGSYCPTVFNPFAFEVSANQTYDSGSPRTGNLVFTYNFDGNPVVLTIEVTQEWTEKIPPVLNMYLYVDTEHGGQGRGVTADTVQATSTSDRAIYFTILGPSSSGYSWMITQISSGPASSFFSGGYFGNSAFTGDNQVNSNCYGTHAWTGQQIACALYLKSTVTNSFTITIKGEKDDDSHVTRTLVLTVIP